MKKRIVEGAVIVLMYGIMGYSISRLVKGNKRIKELTSSFECNKDLDTLKEEVENIKFRKNDRLNKKNVNLCKDRIEVLNYILNNKDVFNKIKNNDIEISIIKERICRGIEEYSLNEYSEEEIYYLKLELKVLIKILERVEER